MGKFRNYYYVLNINKNTRLNSYSSRNSNLIYDENLENGPRRKLTLRINTDQLRIFIKENHISKNCRRYKFFLHYCSSTT